MDLAIIDININTGYNPIFYAKSSRRIARSIDRTYGPTGVAGPQGIPGPEGPAGIAGTTGPQGIPGPEGPVGGSGAPGAQGIQGPEGPIGVSGSPGAPGTQGIQGIEGPVGPTGLQGPEGAQGPQGIQGDPGPPGAASTTPGSKGSRGPQGLRGSGLDLQQNPVSVGEDAGIVNQGLDSVAIGQSSGNANQNTYAVAVGREAGSVTQGSYSVAVGPFAGFTSQQSRCVAVGAYAGYQQQGQNAISIGHRAGYIQQGAGSIAIGFSAGLNKQAANSIVISAAGVQVDNTVPNSCIITPIRNLNAPSDQRLYYSPNGTAEITSGGDSVSSIRYKQDVIELPRRYIDAVFDLKPVEFEFKTDSRKRTIGLIAEDVLEHIPEIVMFNALDDTVVEGLEIDRLVAPLVAIAQQHEIRINTLRDQLLQCNALVQQGDDRLESDKFSIT